MVCGDKSLETIEELLEWKGEIGAGEEVRVKRETF